MGVFRRTLTSKRREKLITSGVLMSGFFEGLPLERSLSMLRKSTSLWESLQRVELFRHYQSQWNIFIIWYDIKFIGTSWIVLPVEIFPAREIFGWKKFAVILNFLHHSEFAVILNFLHSFWIFSNDSFRMEKIWGHDDINIYLFWIILTDILHVKCYFFILKHFLISAEDWRWIQDADWNRRRRTETDWCRMVLHNKYKSYEIKHLFIFEIETMIRDKELVW